MTYPVDGVVHSLKQLGPVFYCFSNNWFASSKDFGQLLNITVLIIPLIGFVA